MGYRWIGCPDSDACDDAASLFHRRPAHASSSGTDAGRVRCRWIGRHSRPVSDVANGAAESFRQTQPGDACAFCEKTSGPRSRPYGGGESYGEKPTGSGRRRDVYDYAPRRARSK